MQPWHLIKLQQAVPNRCLDSEDARRFIVSLIKIYVQGDLRECEGRHSQCKVFIERLLALGMVIVEAYHVSIICIQYTAALPIFVEAHANHTTAHTTFASRILPCLLSTIHLCIQPRHQPTTRLNCRSKNSTLRHTLPRPSFGLLSTSRDSCRLVPTISRNLHHDH